MLYFVFRDASLDIDKFDPAKQELLAAAIQDAAMKRFAKLKGP